LNLKHTRKKGLSYLPSAFCPSISSNLPNQISHFTFLREAYKGVGGGIWREIPKERRNSKGKERSLSLYTQQLYILI
jgi:hypothetical protein